MNPYLNLWGNNTIGKGTTFGAFFDGGNFNIGENCKVQSHVSISPGWKIGNNVFIGPGVRFANDKYPDALNPHFEPLGGIVEDDVSIGMGALIGPGVRIGRGSMIGMGAVVLTDVPTATTVVGNPARSLRKED